MPSNKLILILILIFVFIFSAVSLVSLLIVTSKLANDSTHEHYYTSQIETNACDNDIHEDIINQSANTTTVDVLSSKEYQLISNLISHRAPCNILFFGSNAQLISLAELNSEGTSVFLEDDSEKLRIRMQEGMEMYLVSGHQLASKAYELLEHARGESVCKFRIGDLHESNCRLVLKGLPEIVYAKKWDIVVIDGPIGDRPEALGRMGAIYTAAVIARAGKSTDVLVHNTDRIIEKWYSWEFLCNENMVSAKGKLWHFRIKKSSSYGRFCSEARHQIL